MKALFIMLGMFVFTATMAQNAVDKKELRRIEKEKRMQELEKSYQSTIQFVEGKQFVLEAEFLNFNNGNRVFVSDVLNFIYIDSTDILIQIGNNYGAGYNGVGGITVKGTISEWKLKRNDKQKSIFLQISVMSNLGIYQIAMHIYAERNASATLTSITSGRIDYTGNLVSLDKSKVYKAKTS
jgi:hypothetical protein